MEEAAAAYEKIVELDPNYGKAHYAVGVIYQQKEDLPRAIESFEKAISLEVDSFVPYNQLAWIYADQGENLDRALLLAQKANDMKPDSAPVLDTLGWVYYKVKNYDKAVENLRKASSLVPDNPVIHYHLGMAFYRKGLKEKALSELKTSLASPDDFAGKEEAKTIVTHLGG